MFIDKQTKSHNFEFELLSKYHILVPRDLGDLEERIYLNLGQHQLLEEFQHKSGCTKVRRLVARRIPTQSGIYKGETMLVA
jgi:hypothetical protein